MLLYMLLVCEAEGSISITITDQDFSSTESHKRHAEDCRRPNRKINVTDDKILKA